jgi:hypothetical protein
MCSIRNRISSIPECWVMCAAILIYQNAGSRVLSYLYTRMLGHVCCHTSIWVMCAVTYRVPTMSVCSVNLVCPKPSLVDCNSTCNTEAPCVYITTSPTTSAPTFLAPASEANALSVGAIVGVAVAGAFLVLLLVNECYR